MTLGLFALVYLGMLLGRLRRLQLDRTCVAPLGAITLVAFRVVAIEDAAPSFAKARPERSGSATTMKAASNTARITVCYKKRRP